jgi:hypothetical protein
MLDHRLTLEVTMRYMMLMYSRETPDGPSPEEVEYLIRTNSALIAEAKQKACWWPSTA